MAGIVNEAYTLDVNVQEGGSGEATVNVRAWNTDGTSVLDKTTDMNGDITSTVLIAEEHSITGTSTLATDVFNPFNLRALKWGLNVLDVSINLSAPSKQTLFATTNNNLTETSQPTVQGYTGITFTHGSDLVTTDGTGMSPVNNMDEFYDRGQDEAITNEQVTPAQVLETIDGQNYILRYDWTNQDQNFLGQNRAIAVDAGKSITISGASGNIQDLTVTGDVNLGTGTADITLTNLNITSGDLDYSVVATNYTLDNCQVDNLTNSSGMAITINLINGSTFNTKDMNITTINAQPVKFDGVTWGTSCKIIANETVGSVTAGDTILEDFADSNGEAEISFNYEGDISVKCRARNSGISVAAIADDNGSFTDETGEANSSSTGDMNLLPTTPVVSQDAYLFGHNEQFSALKVEVSTAGTGTYGIQWQYWNGAWTNLSGVTDNTNSFKNLGENKIIYTLPGDWATTTINGQGPLYYVRAFYNSGAVTIRPLGRRAALDVPKYIVFVADRTIGSTGLTVTASWIRDTIARF